MTYSLLDVNQIGKAEVVIDIIPKINPHTRPGYSMEPKEIAVHNTGNRNIGAGAQMHNSYLHNGAGGRQATWHLTVDDKYIYQHLPFNENGWHTGDGSGIESGNRNSIGIEICENPDMDYDTAEKNTVYLIAFLRNKFPNIKILQVKGHGEYSGKNCPSVILGRDGSMNKFRDRVRMIQDIPTSEEAVYIVKSGDNLWSIARDHGMTVKELKENNKLKSDLIHPGDVLNVTDKKESLLETEESTNRTVDDLEVGQRITLSRIAEVYATGEQIPESIKGKEYTIQQVGNERVLLEEIYSWVYVADLI